MIEITLQIIGAIVVLAIAFLLILDQVDGRRRKRKALRLVREARAKINS